MGDLYYYNEFNTILIVNALDVLSIFVSLRGGNLYCLSKEFRIGNWNVEGLIELKLAELEGIMTE